jgi:excinuclease ABC subunit A
MSDEPRVIRIRGAREHNLKGLDVDLPRESLVAITGPSGSGKSSLAFDTICAEGQRRYLATLTSHARHAVAPMRRPAVDDIRGLSPTVAVGQRTGTPGPRSTVGTLSEVYDYLRILFARAGVFHCPRCEREVRCWTAAQIVNSLLQSPPGSKWLLLAPLVDDKQGDFARLFSDLRIQGFTRVRVDGQLHEVETPPKLAPRKTHRIELIVDRFAASKDNEALRRRLTDSVELALRMGEGRVTAAPLDGSREQRFSTLWQCDACARPLPEPSPQLFAFNSGLGACSECDGLGTTYVADPSKLIPDPTLSIEAGALAPFSGPREDSLQETRALIALLESLGISSTKPIERLAADKREILLHGNVDVVSSARNLTERDAPDAFIGIARLIERRFREARTDGQRTRYESYLLESTCLACDGTRLREEARAVRFLEARLTDLLSWDLHKLARWFEGLVIPPSLAPVATELLREVMSRLRFLENLGLGYLTLARHGPTLSAGELQRIRIASHIGTELTGLTYVLDEPSLGLHPRDTARLASALRHLQSIGNTVIIVEHDKALIQEADWLVELGPGAGSAGGELLSSGTPADVATAVGTATGRWLSGVDRVEIKSRRLPGSRWVEIFGARINNLRGLDTRIPVGLFTVVSGVSGAGKSSLVCGVLARSCGQAECERVTGMEHFERTVLVDQSGIGRTPRSNPASYMNILEEIRTLFAATKDAKAQGFGAARFSFNAKGGRCETCRGDGLIRVEMHLLPDVWIACETCSGKRFNPATLAVRYKGLDIARVLELSVTEARDFFAAVPRIARPLETLDAVGLGYLQLGQPAPTLSGGEAQRLKLARGLASTSAGQTLYLLDEPTTGLHFGDVCRLLDVLQRLVDAGHTVVVVEHDTDVLKSADWVIDLGPEAGPSGGLLVGEGPPELIATLRHSHTGRYLANALAEP